MALTGHGFSGRCFRLESRLMGMSDEEFLAAFEARTLDEFHHRDHIKVTYLYLRRYPLEEAMAKVRTGIQEKGEGF